MGAHAVIIIGGVISGTLWILTNQVCTFASSVLVPRGLIGVGCVGLICSWTLDTCRKAAILAARGMASRSGQWYAFGQPFCPLPRVAHLLILCRRTMRSR